MSTALWQPARDELDHATASTQAALDAGASPADRLLALAREERTHQQYLRQPGADAELQRDAERTLRDYQVAHPAPVAFLGREQRELEAG